ncbi:post-GPI attachment to proteins factor 4 [Alligator mississippiensis]|uniref:post-GPI attachment to proteins factor 4 n=1 Tax=Alligator mississippiensis TaxID=8496 RepID=UPI0003D0DF11|nr:post-GPI attachment to proteins factor 4 [Alligator mississippiensis]XP_014451677.1 post-GPI attachment to proteins factor 4 [Alligator mississippiensis]XP_019346290.1 post-GPI attachment to proteins factor 4 [Alligator mississippiensis]
MLQKRLWFFRRWCRCSNPLVQLLTLTVVTFGVLAPLACHRLIHSYFFLRRWHLNPVSQEFLKQNQEEGQAALHYFEALQAPNSSEISGAEALRPRLLVTIITVQRRNEFHYVLQVASHFHRLLQKCGSGCQNYRIFLCNVDMDPSSHQDVQLLSNFFTTVNHYRNGEDPEASVNQFEKEKRDYAFCLEQSLLAYKPEYVLLVEDDAVPEEDIFPVLQHLLLVRLPKPHVRDALYLKLYHPERLQHYINPEPMRILEWFGMGMLLGPLLSFMYSWAFGRPAVSWLIIFFFFLYTMALAELVGRHYLLELRRLSPALYNLVPVTECCTPAMLFSAPSAHRALRYLKELYCHQGFAKDIALYSLLRPQGERAYVVEPNLVRHVGMFSSLRLNNNPKLL